jgi:CRISPR-associated protein Csm3
MPQFKAHVIITGKIQCLTGLHIGGTEEGYEIGGMDNPVIKDKITGYPYIPGSSLKGKMRSMMEWKMRPTQRGQLV